MLYGKNQRNHARPFTFSKTWNWRSRFPRPELPQLQADCFPPLVIVEYNKTKKPSLSIQEVEIMTRQRVIRMLYLLTGVLLLILAWQEFTSVGVSLDAFVPGAGGIMLCVMSAMGWG